MAQPVRIAAAARLSACVAVNALSGAEAWACVAVNALSGAEAS